MTDSTDSPARRRLDAYRGLFGSLSDAAAVLAAGDVGVFEALRDGPTTGADLAARLGLQPHRLRLFLDLVAHAGYVQRDGDLWSLPPGEEAFYDPDGPWQERLGARDLAGQFGRRGRATEVLRSGEPMSVAGTGADVSEEERRAFLRYLHAASQEVAREVAGLVGGADVRRIADLGGGVGTYAHAMLRAAPEATAVLVDRPNAAAVAAEVAAEAGLSDRIRFEAVDFLFEDFGDGYDVVILSNVIHLLSAEDNARLLRRVADRLAPGGRVAVKDLAVEHDRSGPASALRFGLSMALFAESGGGWSTADVRGWLEAAGLEHVATHDLAEADEQYLVVGRLPLGTR